MGFCDGNRGVAERAETFLLCGWTCGKRIKSKKMIDFGFLLNKLNQKKVRFKKILISFLTSDRVITKRSKKLRCSKN
jgi:uncharacterized Rossmann fold enzyme